MLRPKPAARERACANTNLPEGERVPACVAACPTSARHFGDLGDPESPVARLVAERGGYDLLPEMDYRTVNKYLPPRLQRDDAARETGSAASPGTEPEPEGGGRFLRWLDATLSR